MSARTLPSPEGLTAELSPSAPVSDEWPSELLHGGDKRLPFGSHPTPVSRPKLSAASWAHQACVLPAAQLGGGLSPWS